jgi:hypothetical protein
MRATCQASVIIGKGLLSSDHITNNCGSSSPATWWHGSPLQGTQGDKGGWIENIKLGDPAADRQALRQTLSEGLMNLPVGGRSYPLARGCNAMVIADRLKLLTGSSFTSEAWGTLPPIPTSH